MNRFCVAVVALLAAACASAPADEPAVMPVTRTAVPDPRVAELQTQLTELLERIDVLNQRIALLEESRAVEWPSRQTVESPSRRAQTPPGDTKTRRHEDSAPAHPPQPALASAQMADNYRQAIALFGRGRHAEARQRFEDIYQTDASGDLADNALFWIGETYFAAKDYTNAVRYYQRVVSDYGSENKAPDALFKIAIAQERTGDLALARRTLQQVIDRFPYSSTASSAKAELERIRY